MTKRTAVNLFLLLIFQLTNYFCYARKQGTELRDSLLHELNAYKSLCQQPCISDSSKVNLLNELSWEYKFEKPDSALLFGKSALEVAEKINWTFGIACSYHQVASCYNNISEFFVSIDWYLKAIAAWESLEKEAGKEKLKNILIRKSKTMGNLAAVYDKVNMKTEAIDCYFKALKIDEQFDNKEGIATKLGNIGMFFYRNEQFSKALDYLLQSLKIDEELKNKKRLGANFGNAGLAYWKLGDNTKALEFHLKSLEINKEVKNRNYIARDLQNIALIYEEQENYPLALQYYAQALAIKEELGDRGGVAIIYGNIGSFYQDRKKYAEAERYLLQSVAISDSIHDLGTERDNITNLSKLYEETKNFTKALQYYKKTMALSDSLFSEEKTQEITTKVAQYDFDKKQAILKAEQDKKDAVQLAEIQRQKLLRNSIAGGAGVIAISSLLIFFFYKRKRDAEQKQKEMSLSLQVSETEMKALRSQMNPHFIFNALQSIQTFLISHKSEEANTYLLKFSKLMRLVLENSQHREISLQKDMQALELYMQLESIRLPYPFTYQFHIDKELDIEETTIPPLILQPFVENAIWHGLQYKNEPGHINIYISKRNNELHATVEDNGIGRDMSRKTEQPMLMKKESLGMKLTEERLKILNEIKKIKAQFKITDMFTGENTPAGTKVELTLPFEF